MRNELLRTREFNGWSIEEEVHLAQDGEAIRLLGSWGGNTTNANAKWEGILEKQLKIMKLRDLRHPSTIGRVLITKALVIPVAYYLMTVNGIPRRYLLSTEKDIRNFIWKGRKGQMA